MPTLETAIVYPGTVLFEGIMLSEGRGTTRPFELVGAPWIDAERFARDMNALGLTGVHFRPAVFEPTFQKHAKQTCGGCQIHVIAGTVQAGAGRRRARSDVQADEPVEVRLASAAVRIRARQDADRHPGRSRYAAYTDRGGHAGAEIAASWKADEDAFRAVRDRFLVLVMQCKVELQTVAFASAFELHDHDRVLAIPGDFISCSVGGTGDAR
jgi:uncharacterized protein YbbC (DUF1343 family)